MLWSADHFKILVLFLIFNVNVFCENGGSWYVVKSELLIKDMRRLINPFPISEIQQLIEGILPPVVVPGKLELQELRGLETNIALVNRNDRRAHLRPVFHLNPKLVENWEFFNAMMLIEKQVALWKLIGLFRTSDFIQDCLLDLEFRCSK